jgi:broad specificity phosphatase PhoE
VTSTARRPLELLLVRHGTTPTTGKVLPGRAPGLHLAELGQAQAEADRKKIKD